MNTYQDPLLYTMNTGFPLDTYNKKDKEDVPMDRAKTTSPLTGPQKRARVIRTLNQEYGTRDLRYLGAREQQQEGELFGGT